MGDMAPKATPRFSIAEKMRNVGSRCSNTKQPKDIDCRNVTGKNRNFRIMNRFIVLVSEKLLERLEGFIQA